MNTQSKNKKLRRGLFARLSRGASSIRNPQSAIRDGNDRRGILLLVVLSLLVLFLLVGTSYVVSSNQYRKANKTLGKPYAPAKSPLQHTDLLEEVVNQLVRDTTNEFSSLRYHSLLRDLYGADGIEIGPSSALGIQFVDRAGFSFTDEHGHTVDTMSLDNDMANVGNQFFWAAVQFDPNNAPLSTQNAYYNGRVFTLMDGPALGRSARIVKYRYDDSGVALFYLMFIDSDRTFNSAQLNIQPAHGAVLNGRPFNGTGVGYNPGATTTERLTLSETVPLVDGGTGGTFGTPMALAPNATFSFLNWPGIGGSDESYDAVDFQNMALALSPVSPIETLMPDLGAAVAPNRNNPPPQLGNMVLPSFHRPALINYWADLIALQTEPNLLRKVMLRPSWYDHPEFTGSNPDLADLTATFRAALLNNPLSAATAAASKDILLRMIYGPWDVDNDNDGRRDSVWVDFGAPVMMGPQGKLVKPLTAILCVDLDGRLNLNAHGTRDLAGIDTMPPAQNIAGSLTSGVMSDQLPRGQGYGPAEISLEPVLGQEVFGRLLTGVLANDDNYLDAQDNEFGRNWSGKYGLPFLTNGDGKPGFANSYDLLAQLKQQGLPQWANNTGGLLERLGNYATPPDLKGRYGVGLNDLGQPVYEAASDSVNLDQDSPYELNLSRVGPNAAGDSAKDGPFSLAEMERILRAYDADAGKLPPRLWELANRFRTTTSSGFPDINELNEWRALLTTDSFDLPVPNVLLPEWMRLGPDGKPGVADIDDDGNGIIDDGLETGWQDSDDFGAVMNRQPVNLAFADLLEYRIRLGLGQSLSIPPATVDPNDVRPVMSQLLAPELADGLRLDLNRPFGNGRDDNNNGVVDEPGEYFDANNNGVFDSGEVEAPYWEVDGTRADAKEAVASTGSFTDPNSGAFRDSFDRNGNGTIEPFERGDADGDGTLSQTELVNLHNFRRQLYARHLYVLAMTLVDPLPSGASQEDREKRARQLAQWAINVADFRDPDNIMTAFEYDVNPFNGWDVDGNVNDPNDIYGADKKFGGTAANADTGGLVWGAERPELLITETLAWHDRNTFDSLRESVNSLDEPDDELIGDGIGDVRSGDDMTHDQELRPEGAAFIELYNPWPAETAANADTHAVDANGNDLGINLARTHDNLNTGSPVWRMMVYRGGAINLNPDDPDTAKRPNNLVWLEKRRPPLRLDQSAVPINQKADRSIYFTSFDPADRDEDGTPDDLDGNGTIDWDGDDGVAFFSSLSVPPVRPGRYMVVAGVDTERQNTGTAGEYLVKYGLSSNRGIRLNTNNVPNAVSVLDSGGIPVMDMDGFPVESPADDGTIIPQLAGDTNASMTSLAIIDRAVANSFYGKEPSRRFTFSEPAGGYPDVVPLHNSRSVIGAPSGWNPSSGKYSPVMDRPLDERRAYDPDSVIYDPDARVPRALRETLKRVLRGNGNAVTSPTSLNDGETRLALPDDSMGIRTIPGFCWVYLQRLANPMEQWNPERFLLDGQVNLKHDPNSPVNPYRTIDVSGVNVTVFNGQTGEERQWPPGVPREEGSGTLLQPKVYSNNSSTRTFASVQRGRLNDPTRDVGNFMVLQDRVISGIPLDNRFIKDPHDSTLVEPVVENLWSPEAIDLEAYWRNRGGPLGFGLEEPRSESFFDAVPDCTLGFINERFRDPNDVDEDRQRVLPGNPFPWITWNNRSYVSSGELLQVPKYSMAELPRAFSFAGIVSPIEKYDGDIHQVAPDDFELDGPYSHLMNFFRVKAGNGDDNMPNTQDDEGIAGLYRVLDYVGVPSRSVGTETWLNPASFSGDPNSVDDLRYLRQPPFNKVSAYREPGRVNLNTIVDARVWDGGVMHRDLFDPNNPYDPFLNTYLRTSGHSGPMFDDPNSPNFITSRRGYGTTLQPTLQLFSDSPTFFANPFRSPDAANLVPLPDMLRTGLDCTVLRSSQGMSGLPATSSGLPVFYSELDSIADVDPNDGIPDHPEFASVDTKRNAYFRYQPISRLKNLTTTRSNVYAVWITIGFFEVEEAPPLQNFPNGDPGFATINGLNATDASTQELYARVYPEGYRLGREMGSDTGEFERLREFAIIDRSIPVAFEPGEDHNVERAVRLRRRIE